MPLHHARDGYTFRADAQSLTIDPGPKPITLSRSELEQLGLAIRDDYRVPLTAAQDGEKLIPGILPALAEALRRFAGPSHLWTWHNLRRAMVLIGGLDEKTAQGILDQEGL